MSRWFVPVLMMVLVVAALYASEGERSVDEILSLYTQAAGGKEAIEGVKSVEMLLRIEEPTFKVDAIYHADRKLRMRIDIFSDGKRVYTEAYDGKNAWQMGEDGVPQDSRPEGAAALWHGIVFPGKLFGLHELQALGHKVELSGREKIDGVEYHVLKLILSDGFEKYFYIHPETWRIERTRDFRALHPDVDPKQKWLESRASDFRSVEGVMYSFQGTQVDLKTGQVIQTTTLKEIKINPSLDETQFQKPAI